MHEKHLTNALIFSIIVKLFDWYDKSAVDIA